MAFLFAYDRKAPVREEDPAMPRANSQVPSRQPSVRGSDADTPLATPNGRMDHHRNSAKSSPSPLPIPKRRNIVLADHIAFKYLEEDPAVSAVKSTSVLCGYELYLVEQWPCSRQSPTLVIATYTGDQRHSIVVGVLSVPADEATWSPRLRVFFKAIQQHHARPKDTPLGELMVTNLSSFPSAFTAIPVPEGNIRKYHQSFMVNENLKRMGCAGRSGLTLTDPTPATRAKFYQLYKVSERVSLFPAVLELVRLCQIALFIFGHLDIEYTDGLLCDLTETAIRNWWTEIGADYYSIEPSDGILGPTTVAALLGTLMGARGRLNSYGANPPKDVFDVEGTRRAVSYFQKYQKYERTGRLDPQTLLRLQTITAKAAAGEGWGVPKAVKSTMAEIGGKRGEIVMEMVSGRDKGGIGEIETTDIDRFISLVSGERAKWLWHGKPRRSTVGADSHLRIDDKTSNMLARQETTSSRRTNALSLSMEEDLDRPGREENPTVGPPQLPHLSAVPSSDSPGERDPIRKTVFKSVAGKVSDARSGLGRIKDAVGGTRKTHNSRPSMVKDDFVSALTSPAMMTTSPTGPLPRAFTWKNKPEEYADAFKKESENGSVRYEPDSPPPAPVHPSICENAHEPPSEPTFRNIAGEVRRAMEDETLSATCSAAPGELLDSGAVIGPDREQPYCTLRRRHSLELVHPSLKPCHDVSRWPRRLSFGDAEEAVLCWEEIADISDVEGALDATADPIPPRHLEELIQSLSQKILDIRCDIEPWATQSVKAVEALDAHFGRQRDDMQLLATQLAENNASVGTASAELIAEERSSLGEAAKEIEVLLARLEYEMNALVSKVEDVEEGVVAYERQVVNVEGRVEELRMQLETESWVHWFVRTLTGIGTGPNITRPGGRPGGK
ncbi:related to SIN3 protein-binding protein STB2 [Cephalotrichum gorgonifer]|uniref:Related to SIN3 protein-binding protein STB2 n=1 Tax=Cephalotrichum gorgonifer TaxID=2041049 RepID=A0AAE8MYX9_9PEZI|nr:related to SIN3 protein-binding protein STB2 [Cephalotrichum gorgonifer]